MPHNTTATSKHCHLCAPGSVTLPTRHNEASGIAASKPETGARGNSSFGLDFDKNARTDKRDPTHRRVDRARPVRPKNGAVHAHDVLPPLSRGQEDTRAGDVRQTGAERPHSAIDDVECVRRLVRGARPAHEPSARRERTGRCARDNKGVAGTHAAAVTLALVH